MAKRLLITSETIGHGDGKLGHVLMRNFLYSVARNAEKPTAIMLANGAVRLACEGSDSLDDLRLLVEDGVLVKACGTCLDFLGIADTLAVGVVGTMPGMVEAVCGDGEIVTIG